MTDTIVLGKGDFFGCIAVVPRELASDPDYIKHVRCEGARFHVVSYSNLGKRCSEPKCIINKPTSKEGKR